jgi:hypothetical protein
MLNPQLDAGFHALVGICVIAASTKMLWENYETRAKPSIVVTLIAIAGILGSAVIIYASITRGEDLSNEHQDNCCVVRER